MNPDSQNPDNPSPSPTDMPTPNSASPGEAPASPVTPSEPTTPVTPPVEQPVPQTPVSPTLPPQQPGGKKSTKLLIIIGLTVLLIGAALSVLLLFKTDSKQHNDQAKKSAASSKVKPVAQPVKQEFISPVDGSKTPLSASDYYAVTVNGSDYYGKVTKINDDYLRLSPTAYMNAKVLAFKSDDLSGPESATYFRSSHVTKLTKLNSADATQATIITALKAVSSDVQDAYPSQNINDYIKTDRYQAYSFADGPVFFGQASTLKGTFLAGAKKVFSLQATAGTGVNPNTSVSLIVSAPAQYSQRTASDLVYWQNLKPSSKVVQAIQTYEKQNP